MEESTTHGLTVPEDSRSCSLARTARFQSPKHYVGLSRLHAKKTHSGEFPENGEAPLRQTLSSGDAAHGSVVFGHHVAFLQHEEMQDYGNANQPRLQRGLLQRRTGLLTPTVREGATFEVPCNSACNRGLSDSRVTGVDGLFSRVARLLTDIMHVDGPGGTG